MKSKQFYCFALAFLCGVFAASIVAVPLPALWAGFIVFATVAFFTGIPRISQLRASRYSFGFALAALFFLGAVRLHYSGSYEHPLDPSVGKKTTMQGVICSEPARGELAQKACFQPDGGKDRIAVSFELFPRRSYGDRLEISGMLKLPENFTAYDGGPEFDYVSYLAKDNIRYTMSRPRVKDLHMNVGDPVTKTLIFIKSAFMASVERLLPEPHSSLVAGLLLGEKGALPEDVALDFKRSGLTHILVLSGSNVTVVAESLLRAFSFLPYMLGQAAGAVSIVLFAVMTGASTTTVRATVMAMIGLMARGTGRRYDVMRALVFAAFAMVVENPRILAFDISFQLSFLATLALIYVSPIAKDYLGRVPERFGLRETLAMTISTQVFTLPFILYKMGEISVIALIPNLLVLPTVSYAMLGGFVAGTAGLLSFYMALPIAWIVRGLLSYMLATVAFFGELSFATIKARVGVPLLVISYVAFAVIIWRYRVRNSARRSPN